MLPKNAAEWVLTVDEQSVLAIALKAEEGGSDFRAA